MRHQHVFESGSERNTVEGDESNSPIKPLELAFSAFPAQPARRAKGLAMGCVIPRDSARRGLSDCGTAHGNARRLTNTLPARLLRGLLSLTLLTSGCTSLADFVHNGFKVGPNYERPPAPLAPAWIDAANPKVKSVPADYSAWWTTFRDPVLDDLVRTAYAQNVNLRVAGTRVLEARAQRAIAVGTLFPQSQTASGAITHTQVSKNIANVPPHRFFDDWAGGLNASWEIDFWGKIRRTIESTDDLVESSVDDYDNVMVTLIGDVATAYVQYRIFEQQIVYTQDNVRIQSASLRIATARWKAGQTSQLGVAQASSLLEQLEATIPLLETASGRRITSSASCSVCRRPNWLPGSGHGTPSCRARRRRLSLASRPTSFAGGPTSARRSGRLRPRMPRSALPRPPGIRPSSSTAPSATKP
jgi:hypothetical protein